MNVAHLTGLLVCLSGVMECLADTPPTSMLVCFTGVEVCLPDVPVLSPAHVAHLTGMPVCLTVVVVCLTIALARLAAGGLRLGDALTYLLLIP